MMIFGSPYILAWEHRIFNILVSIPHTKGVNLGDRHNNFENPMLAGQDIRENKYHLKLLQDFFKRPVCIRKLF